VLDLFKSIFGASEFNSLIAVASEFRMFNSSAGASIIVAVTLAAYLPVNCLTALTVKNS
jgi:hypothetical protein